MRVDLYEIPRCARNDTHALASGGGQKMRRRKYEISRYARNRRVFCLRVTRSAMSFRAQRGISYKIRKLNSKNRIIIIKLRLLSNVERFLPILNIMHRRLKRAQ